MKKLSFRIKLRYLKVLYAFLDLLTNITNANPYFVRQKIYIGAAIIAVSVTINSCSSSGNHTISANEKKDNKQELPTLCYEPVAPVNSKKEKHPNENQEVRGILLQLTRNGSENTSDKDSSAVILCYAPAFTENEAKTNDTLMFVEQMPQFKGGEEALIKFISQNFKYPDEAIKQDISGRVIIQFVVTKEGKIVNQKILRSAGPILDQEAIRVVKAMPPWSPGKQNGQNVNVYFTLPIVFKLPE